MVRVFVAGGQYACMFGMDNVLDAVAAALRNPFLRSRRVVDVTFDEDPLNTLQRHANAGGGGNAIITSAVV